MSSPLLVLSLIWFFLSLCGVIYWHRIGVQNTRELVSKIEQLSGERNTLVLLLDYASPQFKQMDEKIELMPDRITIVFQAPPWLVATKQKSWVRHCVLPGSEQLKLPAQTAMIIRLKRNRHAEIAEAAAYLDLQIKNTPDIADSAPTFYR